MSVGVAAVQSSSEMPLEEARVPRFPQAILRDGKLTINPAEQIFWGPELQNNLKVLRESGRDLIQVDPSCEIEPNPTYRRFAVISYDGLQAISRDNDSFTSTQGVLPGRPQLQLGGAQMLLEQGGVEHQDYRNLINPFLKPAAVKGLEGQMRALTQIRLEELSGRSEIEFVSEFAKPLPIQMIARLVGLPLNHDARLIDISDEMVAAVGSTSPAVLGKAAHALLEYLSMTRPLYDERLAHPTGDLISHLASELAPGGVKRPDFEVILDKFMTVLLVAGNETTRNGTCAAVDLLLSHPDQLEKFRKLLARTDPNSLSDDRLLNGALSEMLRLRSPVRSFQRVVARDCKVLGVELVAGDVLNLIYDSANRDERVFKNPERFDIERKDSNALLSFGIGEHACAGQNLARMEMRVMLREFFGRFPNARMLGEPVLVANPLVRTHESLFINLGD